jgi:nucleoside-diphosphate-sugar epimerase
MTDGRPRVFLAGASGLIGVRLVPLLVRAGHDVAGLTRTAAKAERLAALGAAPVVADALDGAALVRVVRAFSPDRVMHQLTDLPDKQAELAARGPAHVRLLRDGTRNLLQAAGSARVVAQSIAWQAPGETGRAYEELEAAVLGAGGGVVRFGQFYGPGTYYETELPDEPRIHIDTAARRAFEAMDAEGIVIATD